MSVPPMQSFIDALLRVQAQRATFFRQPLKRGSAGGKCVYSVT